MIRTAAAPILLSALALAAGCTTLPGAVEAEGPGAAAKVAYMAGIDVVRGDGDGGDTARGRVFHDQNRDGRHQVGEPGVAGVLVSNGLDVVRTGDDGRYALPARDDMSLSVIQPAGWRTPTNAAWVPQFSYEHKPAGSPKALRFGGLPATGPLPGAVNFPLIPTPDQTAFDCAVLGDTQTYANGEISHVRDTVVDNLADKGADDLDCLLLVGDVMGDDLGLIPRLTEVIGALQVPQYWIHGNHDFDFDADSDADSADTWRRLWGPNYFAFEMGDAVFIALDNVVYPCTAEDTARPGREFCVEAERKVYNGRVPETQMTWLKNLLAEIPEDRTIVFAHHIPFVSFMVETATQHQTDNANDIYALVEGRKVLSLSGHTHTIENHQPGDGYAGWAETVGVEAVPFQHIVAGAVSGSWWHGDFDIYGTPMSLQRLGGPRGWLTLSFDGPEYVDTYWGANLDRDKRMWLGVNTPAYRDWFDAIFAWWQADAETRDPVPPRTIADLPDPKLLTPEDLAGGSFLTANVWHGSTATTVTVRINDADPQPMTRTQEARGEATRTGAAYADPFATARQLTVARFAHRSRSGEPRHQGYEAYRGGRYGPAAPQPQTSVADRSMHLWRYDLPADLPEGTHVATIAATDVHGRVTTDRLVFEVRAERPPAFWRHDVWNAFEDGPPVR